MSDGHIFLTDPFILEVRLTGEHVDGLGLRLYDYISADGVLRMFFRGRKYAHNYNLPYHLKVDALNSSHFTPH